MTKHYARQMGGVTLVILLLFFAIFDSTIYLLLKPIKASAAGVSSYIGVATSDYSAHGAYTTVTVNKKPKESGYKFTYSTSSASYYSPNDNDYVMYPGAVKCGSSTYDLYVYPYIIYTNQWPVEVFFPQSSGIGNETTKRSPCFKTLTGGSMIGLKLVVKKNGTPVSWMGGIIIPRISYSEGTADNTTAICGFEKECVFTPGTAQRYIECSGNTITCAKKDLISTFGAKSINDSTRPSLKAAYEKSFICFSHKSNGTAAVYKHSVNTMLRVPVTGASICIGALHSGNDSKGTTYTNIDVTSNSLSGYYDVSPIFPIDFESVSIPTGGIYTYDGSAKTGITANSNCYTISGTNSATNAGTYAVYVSLQPGYCWSDGSVDTKTITWKINKAKISVPKGNEFIYDGSRKSALP